MIINALNRIVNKFKPHTVNNNKPKPIYPTDNDLKDINEIIDFVNNALTNNSEFKDKALLKMYFFVFGLLNREYGDPQYAQRKIAESIQMPFDWHIEKIANDLQTQKWIKFSKEKGFIDDMIGSNYYSMNREEQLKVKEYNLNKLKEISIDEFIEVNSIDKDFVIEMLQINYNNLCINLKNY